MSREDASSSGIMASLAGVSQRIILGPGRDTGWTNGVVAIMGADSLPKGTGFVVSKSGLIATCSHVLAQAGWPFEEWDALVRVRFLATRRYADARVIAGCFASQVDGDIAILALEKPLPKQVRVLPLAAADGVEDHKVFVRGYPAQNPKGLAGHGVVVGEVHRNGRKELQFESTNTTFGYSGGPIWDEALQRVIGIIMASPIVKPGERLAYTNYAAKAGSIVALCPERLALTPPALGAGIEPQTRVARRWMIGMGLITLWGLVAVVVILYFLLRPDPLITEPKLMEGLFNVVVADFGEVDDPLNGPVQVSQDGQFIADKVFEKLGEGLTDVSDLVGDVELQHEYVDAVSGNTPAERQEAAARLAEALRADIVIYGNVSRGGLPAVFKPEFYVSPRLTGAEESTGSSAFGSEIVVHLPLDRPDNRAALVETLLPRYEALTELIYGLAFFKKGLSDEALDRMELAAENERWSDQDGKEILYVWLGATYNQRVMDANNTEPRPCEWAPETFHDDWACAQAAYEHALSLNDSFARALIGEGKLWFDQAVRLRDGRALYQCDFYAQAVEAYQQALSEQMLAADTAYLEMKARYNIGLAYAMAAFNCGQATYEQAKDNLTQAINAYLDEADVHLVRDIGAKAYYQLGLVQARTGDYDEAVASFEQARLAAEPDDEYEDTWQAIRWQALSQQGYAYISLAEEGDSASWNAAIGAFELVTDAAERQRFGDPVVLGTVYLGLGTAQNQTEDYDAAKSSLETAIRFARVPDESLARWSALVQRDGHLQLGQTLSALATSAESERYHEALASYSWIVDAHDSGSHFIGASDKAEALYYMGQVYEAQGRTEQAGQFYREVLTINGAQSDIIELTQNRLSAIGEH